MIRHIFLDKTNSIIEGSKQNIGLNPVLYVGYGHLIMRGLIHFDMCKIKELIDDKTFANLDKLKFTLKMTNCFSIDGLPYEKTLVKSFDTPTRRAASFDLILFKLPCEFDEGRGFDFSSDFWVRNNRSFSTEGSNWYFAQNGMPWNFERKDNGTAADYAMPDVFDKYEFISIYKKLLEYSKHLNNDEVISCEEIINDLKSINTTYNIDEKSLKGGIYDKEFIEDEYQKYLEGKPSIIVASQHFDFGDEGLSMDITDYVLSEVESGKNYGLCLAFAPNFEFMNREFQQYVGFVDDNTNTFFHPYVEAQYDEHISDDRESFTLGRKNRLYLYSYDNGEAVNLDKVPSCSINGVDADVKQATKGVYYAEFDANDMDLEDGAIYYDNWSEIELNGRSEDDVELEFSTRPKSYKMKVGSASDVTRNVVPSLYGINDNENVNRGDVREIVVDFRKEFEMDKKFLIDSAEYRLYVKDGNREITVIDYQPIEKAFLNNFFLIYTEDLIPNKYHIDIRMKLGREVKYFKDALVFKVVSDVTERYQ